MEFLKAILGDELYAQFAEKLNAYNGDAANKDKQIKLANLGSGEYVGKGKYDALQAMLDGKETELTTANGLIAELKKGTKGNDELQGKITGYETQVSQLQAELEKTKLENAIQLALDVKWMAWARRRAYMAYEFVYESEAKRYRSDCSRTLKKTCELLRAKGISAQFTLVGSGARNMITRNGDGPYDLDYNLLIMKAEERYWNDLRLLKETVRNALNRAERREFFSDAQDSTSCLTALLHFKDTPNVEFSFDVAITTKNKNGNYMRLIHNKNVYALGLDQYTWNEVPNSHQVKDRADKLKRAGLWQKVRDRYLEKKNMYLFRQDLCDLKRISILFKFNVSFEVSGSGDQHIN